MILVERSTLRECVAFLEDELLSASLDSFFLIALPLIALKVFVR